MNNSQILTIGSREIEKLEDGKARHPKMHVILLLLKHVYFYLLNNLTFTTILSLCDFHNRLHTEQNGETEESEGQRMCCHQNFYLYLISVGRVRQELKVIKNHNQIAQGFL